MVITRKGPKTPHFSAEMTALLSSKNRDERVFVSYLRMTQDGRYIRIVPYEFTMSGPGGSGSSVVRSAKITLCGTERLYVGTSDLSLYRTARVDALSAEPGGELMIVTS